MPVRKSRRKKQRRKKQRRSPKRKSRRKSSRQKRGRSPKRKSRTKRSPRRRRKSSKRRRKKKYKMHTQRAAMASAKRRAEELVAVAEKRVAAAEAAVKKRRAEELVAVAEKRVAAAEAAVKKRRAEELVAAAEAAAEAAAKKRRAEELVAVAAEAAAKKRREVRFAKSLPGRLRGEWRRHCRRRLQTAAAEKVIRKARPDLVRQLNASTAAFEKKIWSRGGRCVGGSSFTPFDDVNRYSGAGAEPPPLDIGGARNPREEKTRACKLSQESSDGRSMLTVKDWAARKRSPYKRRGWGPSVARNSALLGAECRTESFRR